MNILALCSLLLCQISSSWVFPGKLLGHISLPWSENSLNYRKTHEVNANPRPGDAGLPYVSSVGLKQSSARCTLHPSSPGQQLYCGPAPAYCLTACILISFQKASKMRVARGLMAGPSMSCVSSVALVWLLITAWWCCDSSEGSTGMRGQPCRCGAAWRYRGGHGSPAPGRC